MMRTRRPLLLIPLCVLALVSTGCFGLPAPRTTPDAGTGGSGSSSTATPALSIEEAGTVYTGVLCTLITGLDDYEATVRAPDAGMSDLNGAAAVLQHHLESASAALRAGIWPADVAQDVETVAAAFAHRAEQLDALVEATTLDEFRAFVLDLGGPEVDAAQERLGQRLSVPACPNPDTPFWSVEELRQQYILAGGQCPDAEWVRVAYYAPATEAGNCRTAFLAIYSNVADRDLGVRAFQTTLSGGVLDLLVGPNWVLGAVAPSQYADRLGGTVVDVP